MKFKVVLAWAIFAGIGGLFIGGPIIAVGFFAGTFIMALIFWALDVIIGSFSTKDEDKDP